MQITVKTEILFIKIQETISLECIQLPYQPNKPNQMK